MPFHVARTLCSLTLIGSFACGGDASAPSANPDGDDDIEERDASAQEDDDEDDGAAARDASAPAAPRDAAADGSALGPSPRDAAARDGAVRDAGADASENEFGPELDAALTDAAQTADATTGADAARDPGSAVDPKSCPSELVGWATESGDGVNGTTGGGTTAPVRPRSAAELMMYASDSAPRVIEIAGTFDIPRLDVTSNKTLIGIGKDATIRGGVRVRGKDDEMVSNVILRNLRIDGATTQVDNDAVQLYFAHHVWIDHCEIWDGPDGNLDMTHAVNWITVSWTKLRYTEAYKRPSGESMDHRYASLVGHSDNNASEDMGRIKVSFHHNWWAERVIERMPRVRFGQVHVFNNLFASPGNNYCVRAGRGARLLIEGNYFDQVNSPHEFNNAEDEATAHITARNNVYNQTTGTQATNGGGMPFTSVPYRVNVEPAERVPNLVRTCAGPR